MGHDNLPGCLFSYDTKSQQKEKLSNLGNAEMRNSHFWVKAQWVISYQLVTLKKVL